MTAANGFTIDYLPCGRNGSATLTARLGDEIVAHEKLDLGKPDHRSRFTASITKGRPGLDANAIDRELLRIGAELSARKQKADDTNAGEPVSAELLQRMPEQVRAEARAMLERESLFIDCYRDVAALGVAGEETLSGTLYLVGVSRLIPKPLATIVQAPTSVGKTYTLTKVAELFPPEAVIHATAMTEQSLYYLPPGSLRHRWIVAGERSRREDDTTAEATRALREMLSTGRLTKLVPMKDGDKIVTQLIEQDGPIAFTETTTLTRIFAEDANRCLLLSADEREEQTRRVMQRLAQSYSAPSTSNSEAIIAKHHALQRMLQRRDVIVPFAGLLAEKFPNKRVEARRAFPHLMGVIQASAMLHQYQRKIDGDGRIIAIPADYRLARLLCQAPLSRLLSGRISDASIRFHERLKDRGLERFTTTEAAKADDKATQTVRDWLKELCEFGAIEQVIIGKGNKPSVWQLSAMTNGELLAGAVGLPDDIEACAREQG